MKLPLGHAGEGGEGRRLTLTEGEEEWRRRPPSFGAGTMPCRGGIQEEAAAALEGQQGATQLRREGWRVEATAVVGAEEGYGMTVWVGIFIHLCVGGEGGVRGGANGENKSVIGCSTFRCAGIVAKVESRGCCSWRGRGKE